MDSEYSMGGDGNRFDLMGRATAGHRTFCGATEEDRVYSPDTKLAKTWTVFFTFTVVVSCFLGIYMASFSSLSVLLWIIVYFCDVVYILHVTSNFYIAYTDRLNASLVTDRRKVICNYLMTRFIPDIITVIPIEIFAVSVANKPILQAMSLLRMTKLLRFYKVIQFFDSKEAELGSRVGIIKGLKYTVICLFTLHSVTCLWYHMACPGYHLKNSDDHDCRENTWASSDGAMHDFHFSGNSSYEDVTPTDAYIAALYWTVATSTSTGFGDISAKNLGEEMIAILAMLIGMGVFVGMTLGGMASMLTSLDQQRANYLHKFNIINSYLCDTECDEDLKEQVVGYYEYLWIRRRGEPIIDVYKGLPITFVAEISYATYKPLLEKAHLFDELEPGFLRMLSLLIHPVLFLPQQIVVARGDISDQMFFIHKGEVVILSDEDDETPVATLKSGKLFGELNVMVSLPRTATVRAVTHCDLMCLEKNDLQHLLKQYPDVQEKLHEFAHDKMNNVESILSTKSKDSYTSSHRVSRRRKSSYIEPSKLSSIRKSSFSTDDSYSTLQCSSAYLAQPSAKQLLMVPQHIQPGTSIEVRRPTIPGESIYSLLSSYHHHSHPSLFMHKDHYLSHINITESVEALSEVSSQHSDKEIATSTCQIILESISRCCSWVNYITIDPESVGIQIWQKLVMFISVFLCIMYPYMACFTAYDERKGYTETTFGKIVLTTTYVCDFILFMDILVKIRTGISTPHGTLTDYKDIFNYYCKSRHFVTDLLSVLPLELFALIVKDRTKRLRIFPCLKLNRLIKVFDVTNKLNNKEERMEGSVLLFRSFKLLLYIFVLTHWVTCSLYGVVCFGSDCDEGSWIKVWANNHKMTVKQMKPVSEYITALYWAAASMTSTGYGDISAHTSVCRVISMAVMLMGFFLYGYCLSFLAATLANIDGPRVRFQEKIFAIKDFMHSRHLETQLQERVTKYLEIMWNKYGGEWMPGTKQLIHDIPLALRQDIAMEDRYWALMKCPVFCDLDTSFLRKLSIRLVPYIFRPGEAIVYAGDLGREMYIIKKGVCQYVSSKCDLVLTELSSGDYFGDLSMFLGDYQMASVRAKTHVEVLEIRREELDKCLKEFPLIEAQFKEIMEDRGLYLSVRAKLNEKLRQAEENLMEKKEKDRHHYRKDIVGSETEVDSKPKVIIKSNTVEVLEDAKGTNLWDDYVQPFLELKPWYRLLAKIFLMKRTYLPNGYVMKMWIRLRLVIAVIVCISVPLQVAFVYKYIVIWVAMYLIDAVSLINLYLGLHMAYCNEEGILVSHPVSTAQHYLTANFSIDFLSSFPFEIIIFIIDPQLEPDSLHFAAFIRLLRLIQIYRLPLAFSAYEGRVDKYVESIKEFKFLLYIIIFLNAITCVIFVMACPPKQILDFLGHENTFDVDIYHCISSSWLKDPSIKQNVTESGFLTLYTLSLYWATTTSVSVGYGEISAATNTEMVITAIVMILGILFFGYIIASIAASLANADAQRAGYQEKMNAIKRYMEDQEVWVPLQKKTIAYYEYIWQRTLGIEPETLFDGLPLSLWEDITCALYQDSLSKISWFKGSDRSFLKTLSRYIKPVMFRSGDYIVRKSDVGREVYFIYRGIVDVVSDDGFVVFESLTTGQSFGEDAWLFSSPSSSTKRARTNCDLFSLTKQDLDFVLESYPNLRSKITKIAKAEYNKAKKINESAQMKGRAKMAEERRMSSQMYKSVRWEDLKRVDPESRGFESESDKKSSLTSYKAKPRHSIAAGAMDEEGEMNLPPGLKDFHKRLSMQATDPVFEEDDDEDDDGSYIEIAAVTVPVVPKITVKEIIEEETEEAGSEEEDNETIATTTVPVTLEGIVEEDNNEDEDENQNCEGTIPINKQTIQLGTDIEMKQSRNSLYGNDFDDNGPPQTKTDSKSSDASLNQSNIIYSQTDQNTISDTGKSLVNTSSMTLNDEVSNCSLNVDKTDSYRELNKSIHQSLSWTPEKQLSVIQNETSISQNNIELYGDKETSNHHCDNKKYHKENGSCSDVIKASYSGINGNSKIKYDVISKEATGEDSQSYINSNNLKCNELTVAAEVHETKILKIGSHQNIKDCKQSNSGFLNARSSNFSQKEFERNSSEKGLCDDSICDNESGQNINMNNLLGLQNIPGVSTRSRSKRSRIESLVEGSGASLLTDSDVSGLNESRRISLLSDPGWNDSRRTSLLSEQDSHEIIPGMCLRTRRIQRDLLEASSNASLHNESEIMGSHTANSKRKFSGFFEKESEVSVAASHTSSFPSGIQIPLDHLVPVKLGLLGRLNNFTISPTGIFYWLFSEFMCILGFISAWIIIYQVAFQDHSAAVLSISYIIDICYILEIFVKFRLCYFDDTGDLIKEPKLVAINYLKGQGVSGFFQDLVAALPIEFFALIDKSENRMLYLSLLRMLHLLRLIRVFQYFRRWEKELNVNMLFVRLSKFFVILSLILHFFSCVWYVIACPLGNCKAGSWAEKYSMLNLKGTLDAYVTCMYWCVATLTSTGYGDIHPHTLAEMAFAILVMIAGKLLFGLVLANIASTLANQESQRVSYDQKLHTVQSHMHDQHVPGDLQDHVIKYFNYLWLRNKGKDVTSLFKDAPFSLRAEIFLHVTRDMLESIPLLESADDSFMRQLSQHVGQVLFLPGDYIAMKGDMGKEMFYVHRGEVEVVNEDDPDEVDSVLAQGDIFGEVSLVCSIPRRVTIRARTYVDLFTLAKTDLDEVMEKYPEIMTEVNNQARRRFGSLINQKRSDEKRLSLGSQY